MMINVKPKGREMAKKVVKKAAAKPAVKKAAPAKKPVAKKAVAAKKPVVKAAVKPAPKAEVKANVAPAPVACDANCKCGCKGGKFGRCLVKFIVLVLVFACGYCAGKYCYKKHFGMRNHMNYQEMFVNGCLDASKIKCPVMLEKVATADVNTDGCITVEEFHAVKKECKCNK